MLILQLFHAKIPTSQQESETELLLPPEVFQGSLTRQFLQANRSILREMQLFTFY